MTLDSLLHFDSISKQYLGQCCRPRAHSNKFNRSEGHNSSSACSCLSTLQAQLPNTRHKEDWKRR